MPERPYVAEPSGEGQPDFTRQIKSVVVSRENINTLEHLLAAADPTVIQTLARIFVDGGMSRAAATSRVSAVVTALRAGSSSIEVLLSRKERSALEALTSVRATFLAEPFGYDTLMLELEIRDTATHYGSDPVQLIASASNTGTTRGSSGTRKPSTSTGNVVTGLLDELPDVPDLGI